MSPFRPAGPRRTGLIRQSEPCSAGPSAGAHRAGPSEHSLRTMFSEPLLSDPRGMSGEWVPLLTGTVHGRTTGSLSRSAILSSGGAPGVQRPLGAFEPRISPHIETTAGLSTTRASTIVFRREWASESGSSDRRSAAGPTQDPHFTSQNSAGPSSAVL